MNEQGKHLFQFGPFRLNPAERLLERGGQPIPLTPKVFDTLLVLLEHAGHLVEKEELLRRIWPDAFVEEANLSQNIFVLRKTLGEDEVGNSYIETVPKRGYRFVAQVRLVESEESGQRQSDVEAPAEGIPARRMQRAIAVLAVASVVLGVGLVAWQWLRPQAAPSAGKVKLAVLPFANLSGDPEQEYFSNGLTEEMITQLGRLEPERLGVIARTSAMNYKDAHKDTRQIGRELEVDYILEGSVRREGNRVRITAQLIQVSDQSHLWAEDYDRDLRDILALQSEVAGAIAQQIRLKLTPEQHARLRSAKAVNPDAYENYLQGRFFWNKRSVEGFQKAIEFFEKAIAMQPDYAQAYAGLADAYALLGSAQNAILPRPEAMGRAREAAHKALALDDSLADAHTSLGFVKMHFDWDFAGAEQEFLRAIALNPGYAMAHHWYAYDLVALGRMDDAVAEIRRAQKADPLSVIISRDVGELLFFAGRDAEAIAQCRKSLEMNPEFPLAHFVIAWAHHRMGNEKEFLEELKKSESATTYGTTVLLDVLTGKRAEARRLLAQMERRAGEGNAIFTGAAIAHAYLGEINPAFAQLEKAFQNREGSLILLRVAPGLEPLHSDPRFEQLLRRVGVAH